MLYECDTALIKASESGHKYIVYLLLSTTDIDVNNEK